MPSSTKRAHAGPVGRSRTLMLQTLMHQWVHKGLNHDFTCTWFPVCFLFPFSNLLSEDISPNGCVPFSHRKRYAVAKKLSFKKSDLWRIKGIRLCGNNYYQDPNWVISGLKFSLKQLPIPSSWKNKTQVNSSLSSPADGRKRFFPCVGEVLLMRQKTNSWRKKKKTNLTYIHTIHW